MSENSGGFGQQDPFEVFRRLWGPLGVPVPGMAMPTLDPEEVEKRINDLKSVETWLGMNLNMVKMAIQGLEMQKAALQAMNTHAGAAGDAANAFANFSRGGATAQDAAAAAGPGAATGSSMNPAMNPMLWPWALMQPGSGHIPPAAEPPGATPESPSKPSKPRSK